MHCATNFFMSISVVRSASKFFNLKFREFYRIKIKLIFAILIILKEFSEICDGHILNITGYISEYCGQIYNFKYLYCEYPSSIDPEHKKNVKFDFFFFKGEIADNIYNIYV